MNAPMVVAGSGRMGSDIGLFFLRRGHLVTWFSRDPSRLASLEHRVWRILLSEEEGDRALGRALFRLPGGARAPRDAVVVEAVEESIEEKRLIVEKIAPEETADAILASASSSILPGDIGSELLGFHFFHPLELTATVELVVPDDCPPERRHRACELLLNHGLSVIEQSPRTAFAVNRLLLPLQAECLRALMAGHSAEDVDQASASGPVSVGQLSLMDAVGLDVVGAAAARYLWRMADEEAEACRPLVRGLELLLQMGKRGRKNRDGFLLGQPLPWGRAAVPEEDLAARLRAVLLNTMVAFRERGEIEGPALDAVLWSVYGANGTLEDALRREGKDALRGRLEDLHLQTGLPYFRPMDGI